jgi:hypothetical protein
MRSISQKILVDRLAHALKSRGVDLKRSAVLEIAAQAFGHADSNHLAAAAKAGDLDPPIAEPVVPSGTSFAWLRDPLTGSAFAFDADAVGTAPGFVVSPYGSLLALPGSIEAAVWPTTPRSFVGDCVVRDLDGGPVRAASRVFGDPAGTYADPEGRFPSAHPWTVGTDDDNRTYQQIGRARDIVRLDCGSTHEGVTGLDRYGLERFSGLVDVDVDMNPFVTLTGMGVSLVDGRHNLTFAATIEYDGHYMATAALAEMNSVAFGAAERLNAAGCVLRWTDDPRFGNLEIELHIPETALVDLQDEEQLEDAILVLLDSPTAFGNFALKSVGIDEPSDGTVADAAAGNDRLPPVHVRYWTDEGRTLPTIVHGADAVRQTKAVRAARALAFEGLVLEIPGFGAQRLDAGALALVDGEVSHVVAMGIACDPQDEHRRASAARTLDEIQALVGPLIERLGGTWVLEDSGDSMTLVTYLPISLSADVADPECWKDALAHLFGDRRKGTVEATYQAQAWQNDYAVDVDPEGPTEIDITWEVLTMDRGEAVSFRDDRDFTEGLIDALLAPKWIRDRQGPSSIRARDAVDDFLDERAARDEDDEGSTDRIEL